MTSANALAYFDKEAETVIITDASQVGLSTVLLQEQQVVVKAVSYPIRCLTDVETRYSQMEKEALSIVRACERFHVYLYEIKFKVLSLHKPLEVIYSKADKPSGIINGWVLKFMILLLSYLSIFQHRRTLLMHALPRLGHVKAGSKLNVADHYIRFIA